MELIDHSPVLDAITSALAQTREVNGGEHESVLTIYRPEGLAVLVRDAVNAAGFVFAPTAIVEVLELLASLDLTDLDGGARFDEILDKVDSKITEFIQSMPSTVG
jgi:hypothetical protein